MEKKCGDSTKNSETLFLPRDVWELTPTSFPVPTPLLKWQTDAENNDKLLNICKNHSSVRRVVSTLFFCISLSLYGTSIPLKYSIFILFSPKNGEIGALML